MNKIKKMSAFIKTQILKRPIVKIVVAALVLTVLGFGIQYVMADIVWTANGVSLSNQDAGIATTLTLKFTLPTALTTSTDFLSVDLTGFTVNHAAAETPANYTFPKSVEPPMNTNVFMTGNDFTVADDGGTITITLADVSNSIPAGEEITMLISSNVLTNRGAVPDVVVRLKTSQDTNWITDTDTVGNENPDAISLHPVNPTIVLDNLNAGMTSQATIDYTSEGAVLSNGKIVFTLPAGFTFSGAATDNVTINSGAIGVTSATVDGQSLTIIPSVTIDNGTVITIIVGSGSKIITNSITLGESAAFTLATKDNSLNIIQTGTDTATIIGNSWTASPSGVVLGTGTAGDPDTITLKFSLGTALAPGDDLFIDLSNNFSVNDDAAGTPANYTFSGVGVAMTDKFTADNTSGVIAFALNTDAALPAGAEITLAINSAVATNLGATTDVALKFKTTKQTGYITDSDTLDAITSNSPVVPTSIVLDDLNANATSSAIVVYTSDGAVPSNGRIVFTLPAGFVLASGDQAGNVTVATSGPVTITSASSTGQVLTIVLANGIADATEVTVVVGSGSNIITNSATSGPSGNFTLTTQDGSGAAIQSGTKTVTIAKAWKTGGTAVALATTTAGDATGLTLKFQLGAPLASTTLLKIDLSNSFDVYPTAAADESKYTFFAEGMHMDNIDETHFAATGAAGIITFAFAGDALLPAGTDITLTVDSAVTTNLGATSDALVYLWTSQEAEHIIDPDTNAVTYNSETPAVALSSTAISATAVKATVTFAADGAIPSNGKIVVTIPNDFTIDPDTDLLDPVNVTVSDNDGAVILASAAVAGRVVTITLNDTTGDRGNSINDGDTVVVVIGSASGLITNPASSRTSGGWTVETKAGSNIIQTGTDTTDIGIIWTAAEDGVTLSSSKAGYADTVTLKFRLGTALANTNILSVDLSSFSINPAAVETTANYTFSGGTTNMDSDDFTATSTGGVITFTLGTGSIPAETEITLAINSSVVTNLGLVGDVTVGLATTYQTVQVDEGETDAIASNAVNPTSITLDTYSVSASSKGTIVYTSNGALPSNGKIILTVPAAFGLTAGDQTGVVRVNGGAVGITSAIVDGKVLTITINQVGGIASSTVVTVVVGEGGNIITNSSVAGVSDPFTLATQDNSGNVIQTGTKTVTTIATAVHQIAFTVEDMDLVAGVRSGPYTVQTQDEDGNAQPATGGVQADLTTNSSSTNAKFYLVSEGGSPVTFVNILNGSSTATFYYYDEKVGTPTLTVSDDALLLDGDTVIPTVTYGTATHLNFLQQPTNAVYGTNISPAITVRVEDIGNNLVENATNTITIVIGTNPAPSTGVLNGTKAVAASGGTATFSTLNITGKVNDGYTLAASANGLTGDTSSTFNISQKQLTITGTTLAVSKQYDGTRTAATTAEGTLGVGEVFGAEVVASHAAGLYDSAATGTSKTIALAYTIDGADAGNYIAPVAVPEFSTAGVISQKQLTINNPTALGITKPYDGDNTSTVTAGSLINKVGVEDVTINTATATYNSAAVAANKDVTVAYTITGDDSGNYTAPANYVVHTGEITQRQLTIAPPAALTTTKQYDGNTTTAVTAGALTNKVGEEDVTVTAAADFDNKNIGDGNKTITIVYTLHGATMGNYVKPATDASFTTGTITPIHLTIADPTLTTTKPYDGGTTAAVTAGGLIGVLEGETVTINTAVANYTNAAVGPDKTINVVYTITGAGAGNYVKPVNYQVVTGVIAQRQLTIADPTLTTSKTYDTNTTAAVTAGALLNKVGEENVGVASAVANYDTAATGTTKTITVAYTINGDNSGNYVKPADFVVHTGVIMHGTAASFTVTPSTSALTTAINLTVTVTAIDTYGNIADGAFGGPAFTGMVFLTTNATAPVWYNQVGNITAGGTKTFTNALEFSTAGTVMIRAEDNGAHTVGTSADITVSNASDTAAPNITNIQASSIASSSVSIAWTTSEVSASSTIQYGTSSSYGSSTVSTTSTDSHSLGLAGLTASTFYHFRVLSSDGAGNTGTSDDQTFTTAASGADITAPVITNVQMSTSTATGATITWTTNETSASSTIQYGLTSSYGSSVTTTTSATSHTLGITGLLASTFYHFRVFSSDASGNTGASGDNMFVTLVDDSTATLKVTGIAASSTYATAGGGFSSGWSWVFSVTVPTNEASTTMKFADWVSNGTSTILAAANIRFYSAQSSNAYSTSTAKTVSGNNYADYMTLNSDLDTNIAGRQIQIIVEAQVPDGSTAGSYSTSYGIKSE